MTSVQTIRLTTTLDYQPQRKQLKAWAKIHYIDKFAMEGDILDAGCGDGFWLSIFREYGMTGLGFDPNRESILKGRKQWPYLDLFVYSIEEAAEMGFNGFDTVFCRGVSPFYQEIDKAVEVLRKLRTMGDRVILALYTRSTNQPNEHGLWMWIEDVYRVMILDAGGEIGRVGKVGNYLTFEVL